MARHSPEARPDNWGTPMCSHISPLADNDYQDRALALAPRGTGNRGCPVAWASAKQAWQRSFDLENGLSYMPYGTRQLRDDCAYRPI